MQILFEKHGRNFDYALGNAERPDKAAEAGLPQRFAEASRAGGDKVSISAEASNLQKALKGESTRKSGYNAAESMGGMDKSAEENPDEKIRELQKELREAMKEQAQAMQALAEAGQALTEAQAAKVQEVKAEQGNGEAGVTQAETSELKDKRSEAQKKASEALAQIAAIQEEIKIAMKAKQARGNNAAEAVMQDRTVVSAALDSYMSVMGGES